MLHLFSPLFFPCPRFSSKQSNQSNGSVSTLSPTVVPKERPAIDSYFEKPLPREDRHFDEIEKTTEEHIKYAKSSVEADQGGSVW